MANLGLLGALGGLGQGLQNLGADIVKRREAALKWAQEEAADQRKEAAATARQQAGFEHEDTITTYREGEANKRNDADNTAAAARQTALFGHEDTSREDTQKFDASQKAADRQATLDRETTIEALRHSNSQDDIKLRHQVEGADVSGVKYGLRYNPQTGKRNDQSPYTELILVHKDGSIVHTGKLILAPQNKSGQDEDPNKY